MTSQAAVLPSALARTAARLRRGRDVVNSIRPAYLLGGFVLVQWFAVLALALTARHNGWLYYAGGDQLWHYTGAYLLSHGHLPSAYVGYGWSVLLLPVARLAGPNLVSALPAIVLFNTLVLLPIALLCVYGIAARIAGRLFGYWAALCWIAIPYLGIVILEPGYHQKYVELTLPQWLGLTSTADFPGTVALVISAYFCLRALDSTSWPAAAAAGLAAGYAIGTKPSNSIFLVAPTLLFCIKRWRTALPFVVGLAPALLTLALWKYRGLGELAATPAEPMRVAGGVGDLLHRIHQPSLNNWQHLHQVLLGLREHFWASRVIEWLPVAGAIALLARAVRGFLIVALWFAVYLLVKGTYVLASLDDASFFRFMMPSLPAYAILAAAVVLLVPGVRARPDPRSFEFTGRPLTIAVAIAAALFVVLPMSGVAAMPRLHDAGTLAVRVGDSLLPVSSSITPRTALGGNRVRLSWRAQPSPGGSVFYRIMRVKGPSGPACAGVLNHAPDDCRLYMDSVGATKTTSFVDEPGHGVWTYRIGVSANWLNDPSLGDIYVVSHAVTAFLP